MGINIEIDDVYSQMSEYEKQRMVIWLEDDGFFYDDCDDCNEDSLIEEKSISGVEFKESLKILSKNRHILTLSEENTIKIIADKYKFLSK